MHEALLVGGVLLWIGVGVFYFRRPAASLFHPVTFFWMEHGLLFVIRPIFDYYYQYSMIYKLYEFYPSMETKNIVLGAADLSLVVFTAVALRIAPMPLLVKPEAAITISRGRFLPSFLVSALLCLPAAVYSLILFIRTRQQGVSTMVNDLVNGAAINTTGNGYTHDAYQMLLTITVVFAWMLRFRPWATVPFAVYFFAGGMTGQRGPIVVAAIAFMLLYLYDQRRRWPTPRLVIAMVLVIFMFRTVGEDRGASLRALFTGETVARTETQPLAPLESMDYANMEYAEYMVNIVPAKTRTYDYFLDNLQLLTEPIPRVLWPGKPVGAPVKRFLIFSYGYPIGITFSVPGEGWAQLGWLGVAIWSAVFAVLYASVYRWFIRSRQTVFQVAAYVVVISASIIAIRDGLMMTVFKGCLFPLLPLLLWRVFAVLGRRPAPVRRTAAGTGRGASLVPGAPR